MVPAPAACTHILLQSTDQPVMKNRDPTFPFLWGRIKYRLCLFKICFLICFFKKNVSQDRDQRTSKCELCFESKRKDLFDKLDQPSTFAVWILMSTSNNKHNQRLPGYNEVLGSYRHSRIAGKDTGLSRIPLVKMSIVLLSQTPWQRDGHLAEGTLKKFFYLADKHFATICLYI